MNYLKQLLAFYDSLELNPLNSSEIALWHALMSINNKAAWSNTFTVASSVLCQRSGLKQANFFKTRNALQQKGLIDWESRGGNISAKYQIKVLYGSLSTNNEDNDILSSNSVGNSRDSFIDSSRDNGIDTSRALNKHKRKETKTKQDHHQEDDDAYRNLINQFQQNFGINSTKPLMLDDLRYTIQDFTSQGTSYAEAIEIVKYALTIAVAHQGSSWSYVKGIIKTWLGNSLFDMAHIKDYQERRNKPKQKYGRYNQKPKETGTDWNKVKAKETPNNSNDLQERLAKMRDKQDATS